MYNNIQDELLDKWSVFLSLYLLNQKNLPNTRATTPPPPPPHTPQQQKCIVLCIVFCISLIHILFFWVMDVKHILSIFPKTHNPFISKRTGVGFFSEANTQWVGSLWFIQIMGMCAMWFLKRDRDRFENNDNFGQLWFLVIYYVWDKAQGALHCFLQLRM